MNRKKMNDLFWLGCVYFTYTWWWGYGKVDDKEEYKDEPTQFQPFTEGGSLFDYKLIQEGVWNDFLKDILF